MDELKEVPATPEEENGTMDVELENGEKLTFPTITIKKGTLFHGSPVPNVKSLIPAEETTVGKGLYLTSEFDPAAGYAVIRGGTTKNPIVYKTQVEDLTFVDLSDQSATMPVLAKLVEQYASKFLDTSNNPKVPIHMKGHVQQIAEDMIRMIKDEKYKNPKDFLSTFGSQVSKAFSISGADGIKALEGGEGGSGVIIGEHDSFVVFDPNKVKIIEETQIASHLSKTSGDLKIESRVKVIGNEPRFQSNIPSEVTKELLDKPELQGDLPDLNSSIIEDFIASKIKLGITSIDPIVEMYFDEGIDDRVTTLRKDLETKFVDFELNDVFGQDEANRTKDKIVKEMEELGFDSEQMRKLSQIKIKISSTWGSSNAREEEVSVNTLQLLRRALDLVKVFPDLEVREVYKSLMEGFTAHELGHKVEDIGGNLSSKIQGEWIKDIYAEDNKSERFAEAFSRFINADDPDYQNVVDLDKRLQVAKVKSMWSLISQHKTDVIEIMARIHQRSSPDIQFLINSRQYLYSGNAPENYAMPYTRDQVKASIQDST